MNAKAVGPEKPSTSAPSVSVPLEIHLQSRSPELEPVSPTLRSLLLQSSRSPAPSSLSSRSLSDNDVDRMMQRLLRTPALAKLLSDPTLRTSELTKPTLSPLIPLPIHSQMSEPEHRDLIVVEPSETKPVTGSSVPTTAPASSVPSELGGSRSRCSPVWSWRGVDRTIIGSELASLGIGSGELGSSLSL